MEPLIAAAFAWTVTVDPLTAALGFAHVQVERRLAPRVSLYAGPSLRLYDGLLADVNGPYRGAGLELGVRGFLRPTAPEGAWIMLRGVGARTWTVAPAAEAQGVGGYTSLLVGGTWIGERGLTLSGGLGGSLFAYGIGGYGPQGPAVAAHSNLGWAF
jgi:hypothetical protein